MVTGAHDNVQEYNISKESVIDTFSRVLQHNIYIVDWQTQTVVHASELPHCQFGIKAGMQGLIALKQFIIPAEFEKYRLLKNAFFEALEHATPDTVVSFGLSAQLEGAPAFLLQHTYPIEFFPDGRLHTIMSMFTLSVRHDDHPALWYDGVNMYQYDFDIQRWTEIQAFKKLTASERTMMQLSGLGYTNEEIAEKMFRSVETIKLYRRNVFRKYNVDNITQAIHKAAIFRHI